jgi:hypothetical protein
MAIVLGLDAAARKHGRVYVINTELGCSYEGALRLIRECTMKGWVNAIVRELGCSHKEAPRLIGECMLKIRSMPSLRSWDEAMRMLN